MTLTEFQNLQKGFAVWAGAVLLICLIGTALSSSLFPKTGEQAQSKPRLFRALRATPETITIQTKRVNYTLARQGNEWVIPEAAGFPVSEDKIARFLTTLAEARRAAASTSLPERHDRLGLTDPETGGSAARISFDAEPQANMLLSVYNGEVFARAPSDPQVWRSDRIFPPLHQPDWWLDFETLGLPIKKTRTKLTMTSKDSAPVIITSPQSDTDAILAGAYRQLSILGVSQTTPHPFQAEITHTLEFADDTKFHIEITRQNGQYWAKLNGDALLRPELTIGRVFRLDPFTASDFYPE